MRKQTTGKRFRTHLTGFDLRGGRLLGLQSDVARCEREETVSADGHPKDRRSQRAEGVCATAYRLSMHDPVCVPHVLVNEREEVGLVELIAARGPEEA